MAKKKDKKEKLLDMLVPTEPEVLEPEVIEPVGLKDLQVRQEQTAIEARYKDLEYLKMLEDIIEGAYQALKEVQAETPEKFKEMVAKSLNKGDFKQFRELMMALGIAYDKREQLLSFDDTRKQRGVGITEFEFRFASPDGAQAGVKMKMDGGKKH
jgi:hypothetical protein